MKHKITNEYDFLVAHSELETNKAREVLTSARESNDYYKEKIAAKLVDFCEAQERAIRLYVEARLYHPELGDLIEKRWPQYRALADDAKEKLGLLDDDIT